MLLLLLSSFLSACQSGSTDQAQACYQKFLPTIKVVQPAQASAQMVYVSNGYDLYALNSGNGAPGWCRTLFTGKNRDQLTGLTYSHGSIYAYTDAGSLVSFHAASGTLVWNQDIGQLSLDNFTPPANESIFGQLAVAEGAVVVPYQTFFPDGIVHFGVKAFNTQNGKLLWQKAIGGAMDGIGANQGWAAAQGLFYVIGEFPDNSINSVTSLYALDARTGAVRWSQPLDERAIDASLLVANNVLYGVEPTGILRAWNAQTGELLWSLHLQAGLLGRLFLLNDHLFLGTNGFYQNPGYFLSAININTHKEDWYANISGDAGKLDYSLVCIGG